MIETEISITVNRKPDINLIEQKLSKTNFNFQFTYENMNLVIK